MKSLKIVEVSDFPSTSVSKSLKLTCGEGDKALFNAVIALSVIIILMFMVICYLSYILYRMRYGKATFFDRKNIDKNNCREIQEPVPLKKINNLETFKESGILSMVDTDVTDNPKTIQSNPQPTKALKLDFSKSSNGTKHGTQPVITPDQMNKVCVEVLSKIKRNQSTSLTHLNELMKGKNYDEKTGKKSQFDDDFDVYDAVPTPRKLGSESDEDMEVYDSPPVHKNNSKVHAPQNYYDNLPIREDLYQNAKYIQDML